MRPPAPESPESSSLAELRAELHARGVTLATAVDLTREYPAERIKAKIEVFDWLVERKDKRVAKSPAGYLVKSIQVDYSPPKGFVSKEEEARRKQAQAQEARKARGGKAKGGQEERAREEADLARLTSYGSRSLRMGRNASGQRRWPWPRSLREKLSPP